MSLRFLKDFDMNAIRIHRGKKIITADGSDYCGYSDKPYWPSILSLLSILFEFLRFPIL